MILRSEVHGAVALIKYQLAIKRFSNHRIKPVSPPPPPYSMRTLTRPFPQN